MDYEYTDAHGALLQEGDRVKMAGWPWPGAAGHELREDYAHGVIVSISDPDGDADDEGRTIGIPPAVKVQFDDGDEDTFTGTWTARGWWDDENAPFEFEDIEKVEVKNES